MGGSSRGGSSEGSGSYSNSRDVAAIYVNLQCREFYILGYEKKLINAIFVTLVTQFSWLEPYFMPAGMDLG